MTQHTTWLVVNAASGSNDEEAVDRLKHALTRAGHAPAHVVCLPDEDLPDKAALDAAGANILVTFTGDGTAGAQVARVHDWNGQVLVLPGGTQNLLARRLHGDRSVDEIVAELGAGRLHEVTLSMIQSAHGDALCEVLAGPGAHWSDVRETMRDGDVAGMAATLAEAIGKSASGPAVALSDPALGKPEGYPAIRLSPGPAGMAVDGYGADNAADFARQGMAILRRDFRQGPHEKLGHYPAVSCRSEEAIELMLDGERATGGHEERFEQAVCPVKFLASAIEP